MILILQYRSHSRPSLWSPARPLGRGMPSALVLCSQRTLGGTRLVTATPGLARLIAADLIR